jgi:cell wall-associated NlpC family hydrolase
MIIKNEKGFFDDAKNLEALKKELYEWKNTPYRHWTGVKGKGCDCIHLIAKIYEKVGAFKGKAITIPKYDINWHLHNGKKLLVDGIRAQLDVVEVDPKDPKNGDVILYKFGLQEAHGGIFIDGRVYQALTSMGVQPRKYEDPDFYYRMKRAFRIKP